MITFHQVPVSTSSKCIEAGKGNLFQSAVCHGNAREEANPKEIDYESQIATQERNEIPEQEGLKVGSCTGH